MAYLQTEELRKGEVYHIKNNFTQNHDELWLNNSLLIDINTWGNPKELTFELEGGEKIVIDGDFISPTSGEHKSEKRYQIIKASESHTSK